MIRKKHLLLPSHLRNMKEESPINLTQKVMMMRTMKRRRIQTMMARRSHLTQQRMTLFLQRNNNLQTHSRNMVMDIGQDSWITILQDYPMVKINLGTSSPDWHQIRTIKTQDQAIEYLLYGWVRDSITSPLWMMRKKIITWIKTLIIQLILKDYGHTSTTVTVSNSRGQLH